MTSYVDQTVTLAGGSVFSYAFPHDHTCNVAISNESQGALRVTYQSYGTAVPPVNIDPGQPYTASVTFYSISVAGVSGAIFNIKIQDEPLALGQTQTHSSTLSTVVIINGVLNAGGTYETPTVPAGFVQIIERILLTGEEGQGFTLTIIAGGTGAEFLAAQNATFDSTLEYQVAASSFSDCVIYEDTLFAGDYIGLTNTSGSAALAYTFELLQKPL